MGEEDDGVLKPRKMALEDDFMQHPDSGAFIRNPLKEKAKSQPTLLSASEFNHNMLDDTLGEWHCVSVNESSFRDLMSHFADTHGTAMSPTWSRTVATQSRCAVGRVHSLDKGFSFVVQLRKSTYVAPRKKPPRPNDKNSQAGVTIDKVNMEVADVDGKTLRVENVTEGLILAWNRAHPSFPVKINDIITRVNDKKGNAGNMIEELINADDLLRMWIHRETPSRTLSKEMSMMHGSHSMPGGMTLAAEGTLLPGADFSSGSLAHPDGARRSSKAGSSPSKS